MNYDLPLDTIGHWSCVSSKRSVSIAKISERRTRCCRSNLCSFRIWGPLCPDISFSPSARIRPSNARAKLRFTIIAFVGALAQIAGTGLLITLFDTRNFAVGTTYSKTETIQAAVFATIFLGETISTAATIGIFISLVGVVTISAAKGPTDLRSLARSWMAKPALIGLASGASFGIAAVGFRGASLSLGGEGFLSQAAYTLTAALAIHTVVMMVAMQLRNPGELKKVARAWKTAVWVGASGAAASVGWFTAMTIQNAALVRALGQIELVFTITASGLIIREKIHRLELIGIFLVVAGILVLLLL